MEVMARPTMSRQEQVAIEGGARAASITGQMNVLAWQLVEMMVEVLEEAGWCPGAGLRSPEHWLAWRTGMSMARAKRLTQIARRVEELPACIALFSAGRLSEDSMAVLAQKAPPERDAELAAKAPEYLHSQLSRILRHLPDQDGRPRHNLEPEPSVRTSVRDDGWYEGGFLLPPDEGALVRRALESARDEVFHERKTDAAPEVRGPVTWADAFVRLCEHGLDGLDPSCRRGEARGERAQVIVHLDARSDGDGSARLHLGPQLPDSLRRYLCCDAKVRAVIEGRDGALLGISPLEPTVNQRLRRVIEQRDGGCRYPGCSQRRWVQIHHIEHREDGGLTVPRNLCSLCPFHHRLHHQGAFSILGDPESASGLRFVDKWGTDIGPPHLGPVAPPALRAEPVFTPPTGGPLTRWFSWN